MELPRFLTFSRTRQLLALSKSSKSKELVPRLPDLTLKAYVQLSDDTLLEYQHDLHTNSTFLNINLVLEPALARVSAVQQYLLVNGLCDEVMLTIDYDSAIVAAGDSHVQKQQLLVAHAEKICNRKLSRELDLAEKLLKADATEFFDCVARRVDSLLDTDIDPAGIESGEIPLAEKSASVYFGWFAWIESCIREFVDRAHIDTKALSIEAPFEFIDLQKVKTLGSLFGEIYEGSCSWVPYRLETRKYHVGTVRVSRSSSISAERIKFCVANCAASFFVTVAKSPIGHKFEDMTSGLQDKYCKRAKELLEIISARRRKEKTNAARKIRKYAELLVRELGAEQAERLKLAMEHDIDLLPIYYATLENFLRDGIASRLTQGLSRQYDADVDASRSVDFVHDELTRRGKLSAMVSPDLLTLRTSHIAADFFDQHPWLSRLNIRKPEIKLMAVSPYNGGAEEGDSVRRVILIRDYFENRARTPNSEIVVDIEKIAFERDRQDEVVVLQQI